MRCCIFGAGEYHGEMLEKTEGALLIAADGGFTHTERYGLLPTLAVGDFDSLGKIPEGVTVIRHPVMKDETDMALAVKEGLIRGCDEFFLFGGMGGRMDHTLANMALLLSLAQKKKAAYLVGRDGVITALCGNASLLFAKECQGILSVFAAGNTAHDVTLERLLYPLCNGILTPDTALGVSNQFIGEAACVSLRQGALYLVWNALDNPLPTRLIHENKG